MIKIFARTDTGRVRKGNEDSFLVVDTTSEDIDYLPAVLEAPLHPHGITLMVSDGMGGAAAGEIASSLAVKTVSKVMRFPQPPSEEDFIEQIDASLQTANKVISEHAQQHPEMRGMGATATIAGILNNYAYFGQIGDSRAYLIRDEKISQKTKDQSFVNQLVEAGKITEEEAETHPRRNVILQALGNQVQMNVAFTPVPLQQNDYLLLCSDGLSSLVKKEEMLEVILHSKGLDKACNNLINLANDRGGHDNITVIIAHINDDSLSDPIEDDDATESFYHSIGDYLKKLRSSINRLTRSIRDLNPKYLFPALLVFLGLCSYLLLSSWQSDRDSGRIEGRIASLEQAYTAFKKNHSPTLQQMPASPDANQFLNILEASSAALKKKDYEQADALIDSANTAFLQWKQQLEVLIALRNNDQTFLRNNIRSIWLREVQALKKKANEIHSEVELMTPEQLAFINALPFEDLAQEVNRIVNTVFWQIHTATASRLESYQNNGSDAEGNQEIFQSPLRWSTEIHQNALTKIGERQDPTIVRKGFENANLALEILGELSEKLQLFQPQSSPDLPDLNNTTTPPNNGRVAIRLTGLNVNGR